MDITCAACRRSYFVPDDLVRGRTFRARCSQCGHAFAVDVGERRGGKARRAPADTMPSTSASAIPDLADALSDADLGWLEEAAAEADAAEREDAYVLLTVQRSRRGSALALAAGAVLLVAALAGLGLWLADRYQLLDGVAAPRAERTAPGAAGPLHDADVLAFSQRSGPGPDEAAPAPTAAPQAPRPKRPRLTLDDRSLLDLLGRKADATPVGLPEEEDQAASATSALDPAAAERVIGQNRRAFDACVSKALRLNPDLKLARRATLVVTVQADGRVSAAAIAEEPVARTALGACLADAARRMAFPAFDGEPLDVAIPLSLSTAF